MSFVDKVFLSLLPFPSPFPDHDKRILIAHFYDAVRSRLIDDLVNVASQKPSPIQRDVKRFKNGFLMSQISAHSGWEPKAITRFVLPLQTIYL